MDTYVADLEFGSCLTFEFVFEGAHNVVMVLFLA